MVKIIALIKRKPEMSREEFLRYWQGTHASYIRALPGIKRYQQNHVRDHGLHWLWDGAAEVWFDSVADVAKAFEGPAADAMRQDEANFIEEMEWILVDEHDIPLEEGASS